MSRLVLLLPVLTLLGWLSPLPADEVMVTGVEGEVLYGAGQDGPRRAVKVGETFPAGTFSAGDDGIAYLRTFSGSELRLAESGTLRFLGDDPPAAAAKQAPSDFQLLQGKLRVTIHRPSDPRRFYRIDLVRGRASVQSGQCIFCMHGDGTYVYVAHGVTMLSGKGEEISPATPRIWVTGHNPIFGANPPAAAPIALHGNGSVGVLEANGVFQVRPLSAVAAGTQNCLLAGFNADAGSGAGHGDANVNANANTVVSPTQ